ncbi:MAG: SusC/RagA family TonB-linked outer membrane protein [Bacteroidetes bacterium]|nr:SusC/RagA family TonB-linked outer membrane protein [Bacteroidota bacterium]
MLLAALKGARLRKRSAAITKTLLAMRLTSILLLATCLHLSAKTRAQINLSEQHVPLEKVFKKITDQTGYLFVYRDEWLKQTRSVTISVRDASLKEALDICFRDQPFTYAILDKMIVLKEKPVQPAAPYSAYQVEIPPGDGIKGRVADSTGAPLVGASIRIKGTKKGTESDVNGGFEMKNIAEGTVLVVSYTGYVTREYEVSARNGTYHYIMLRRSQDELDAMVIQAYGTTSRRFNVGAITTVDAATISKQPVTNVLQALQGQVPGLAVNATSGVPGSKMQLQIRGQNTMLAPPNYFKPYDQPLFIIDGIPFAPQNNNVNQFNSLASTESFNGGISQPGGISPFNGISPADVESVTVLRDADATSIYGTQGSNGVILITTKKGKPGKTVFDLNVNTQFNSNARDIKFLNTPQYLSLRREALAQDGLTPSSDPSDPGFAPDLMLFDTTRYTNWEKTIYGRGTHNIDVHGSLSGGYYNNTFMLSAGYTRSNYNYPGDWSNQQMTLHSQFHHASGDNRLTIDFGVDFGYVQTHSAGFGGNRDITDPPNLPELKNPDGSLVWSYKGFNLQPYQFYANLNATADMKSYTLNNNAHLNYKIVRGLSFGVTAGYSRVTADEASPFPSTAQDPSYISRSAQFGQNTFETINIEPQIDYNLNLGKSNFSALVGTSYKKNIADRTTQQGYDYTSDLFLGSINGAGSVYAYEQYSLYKYAAMFGRLKYMYNQEFIVSLSGRRDGSSNFGPGRQFGSFGSVGLGWIFTQEKAVKNALPFISFGKLYGSYGTSGSDGVQGYQYQALWTPQTYQFPFQGVRGNQPQNLYNPDYSWATKRSLNIALDLGFIQDRILLTANWYRDRVGNQLAGYPLPSQAGFSTVLENTPADVQNSGWEFSLTSTNIKTKNFTWRTNFNISWNRNKLLSFPNLESSSYANSYVIGKPTSIIFGYRYKDVNPTTGRFEFYDAKGQTTYTPGYGLVATGGDQVPIADREVKYLGGFGNTFTYKQLSLYVFIQFSSQTAPNWLGYAYQNFAPGFVNINQPDVVLGKYWTGPGDTHATLQRLVSGYPSPYMGTGYTFSASSGAYSDDTYARLKTVSLSYSVPEDVLKHWHIKGARIYCNVQNLWTVSNYKVGDPELFSNFTAFPIQRTMAMGLNFNF